MFLAAQRVVKLMHSEARQAASLIVHTEEPFNAEPSLVRLIARFITPKDLFYVRNHAAVPRIDPASFRVSIGGLVRSILSLTVDDLRRGFPRRVVTATLECAGNRRRELLAVRPIPNELVWDAGAIGTAEWAGAALCDVLEEAGVGQDARHVEMTGADHVRLPAGGTSFGGSIPIEKARGREVLLAYEMNGRPLAPAHGFPLRAIVPGYIGARSVKWLDQVVVRETASLNHFQASAYRYVQAHGGKPGKPLGELDLNAVICRPAPYEAAAGDRVRVEGYAIGSAAQPVAGVEITFDGGSTWNEAEFVDRMERWAWRRWRVDVRPPADAVDLIVRAWDGSSARQPSTVAAAWNLRGYVNNAWHRVPLAR